MIDQRADNGNASCSATARTLRLAIGRNKVPASAVAEPYRQLPSSQTLNREKPAP
jgi:hypothetical protein